MLGTRKFSQAVLVSVAMHFPWAGKYQCAAFLMSVTVMGDQALLLGNPRQFLLP
jgi:hypothetical protein